MLASLSSATVFGVSGHRVTVEVHVSSGLPGYTLVGLPDASCRESRDRVRAALLSSGLTWPMQRVTVNLAPTDLPKSGAGLDLAIAVGVLVASGQLDATAVGGMAMLGELGLDGSLRRVNGVLPMVASLARADAVVVPLANVAEAAALGRIKVRTVSDLRSLMSILEGDAPWPDPQPNSAAPTPPAPPDLRDVRGQSVARMAIELSAAGGHNLLMVGAPGAGKTMLAERIAPLLGDLDDDAAVRVSAVHSAAGLVLPPDGLIRRPPFRAPHHTASLVAMVGGGTRQMRPGEISLASDGVLFLDELGEFPAVVLDALRQPLEEGVVRISRAHATATLPAQALLVAAMNPCPCGLSGTGHCRCSEASLGRYARRVSGPLLDRFDLRVRVSPTERCDLVDERPAESSGEVAERVAAVRSRAHGRGVVANAALPPGRVRELTVLDGAAERLVARTLDRGMLSGRGLDRIRRVALTLDDLRGGDGRLDSSVMAQALALRTTIDLSGRQDVAS